MGDVHLARSDRGRMVAIKLVREELAAQEEFRARFRYEVEAARRVGGNWTAPVLDADTEAAVPWVATGYVAGPSLRQVVGRDHGPLPEGSVRTLAAGLAHALRDIHGAGLVHRDLKPANVLITIDGPRVIDFGIARALETVTDGGLTRTGALLGSPGFMAPEQVRGERITPACDIFCLGSVLVYAATGKMPFGTAQTGAHVLMFRIAQEEPDLEGVPGTLVSLVRDCLEKDPAARLDLAEVLGRTGVQDTLADGRSHEQWLPGPLVVQLGRHAVSLLDTETPETLVPPPLPRDTPPARAPAPEAASVGESAPVSSPPLLPPQPEPRRAGPAAGATLPRRPTPTACTADQSPHRPQPSPFPQPPPSRKRGRIALLIGALVAALSAGSLLYLLLKEDDNHGSVPTAFLGQWFNEEAGQGTRQLTIRQGEVGDRILSLVRDDLQKDGETAFHCVWKGDLTGASNSDEPVHFGPTTLVSGPSSHCDPGKATTLTLLPNGKLRRVADDSGKYLDYTRDRSGWSPPT